MGFTTAAALVHELMEARPRNACCAQKQLAKYSLLVIDEPALFRSVKPCRTGSRCSASVTSAAPLW